MEKQQQQNLFRYEDIKPHLPFSCFVKLCLEKATGYHFNQKNHQISDMKISIIETRMKLHFCEAIEIENLKEVESERK